MKKTNKKGFTLVELIVVATIMVMVMGAILNFIRPMNKFYQRTQSLADTNDIGSILMDYVDDELRYATNVMVLQDYQGVPTLNGGFLTDSSGNPSYTAAKFTHALIIDNENIRGSLFPGYDADGTVAHRKQARGCIMKANITDAGIETDRLKCLGSEELYADYGCTFEASLNVLENKSSCVTIGMELMRPRREGLGYVFDKFGYRQKRDFELVNPNIHDGKKNRGMYAAGYGGSGSPIDYSKFVPASAAGDSADALYSQTHTYILYTKVVPTTEKVTITVYKRVGSTEKAPGFPWKKDSGYTFDSGEIASINATGESLARSGVFTGADGKKYKERYVGAYTAGGIPVDDYMIMNITTNIDFFFQYTDVPMPEPTNFMTFLDLYDDGNVDMGGYNFPRSTPFYPPGTVEGEDGTVYFDAKGNGDALGEYTFVGWNLDPSATGEPDADPVSAMAAGWFVSGQQYTHDATYYAIYKLEPMVNMMFIRGDDPDQLADPSVAGAMVHSGAIKFRQSLETGKIILDSRVVSASDIAKGDAKDGLAFDYWNVFDDADNEIGRLETVDLSTLDGSIVYVVKPVYKDNSHPGAYEVTVRIDADLTDDWNALIFETPWGIGTELTQEDGSTIIEDYSTTHNYIQEPGYVYSGAVYKFYVYSESDSVNVKVGNSRSCSVRGDCIVVFDGTYLYKAA